MDDPAQGFVTGVRRCFHDLPDPRVVNRCQHRLLDILAITILAVLSGADDWTDMEVFAETRTVWLAQFLELPGGIPSHDTFRRVFGLFERKQFAVCLLRWTQALAEATGGKLIAIDGKTLRQSASQAGRSGRLAPGDSVVERERTDAGASRRRGQVQ
jgi:DDE_Tnp_1-associated